MVSFKPDIEHTDKSTVKVVGVRTGILTEFLQIINEAMDSALEVPGTFSEKYCRINKIGIMMLELNAIGLYPIPNNPSTMHNSVSSYWTDLKNFGKSYANYSVDRYHGTRRQGRGMRIECNFQNCLGDFGITHPARAALQRYTHKVIWAKWEEVIKSFS